MTLVFCQCGEAIKVVLKFVEHVRKLYANICSYSVEEFNVDELCNSQNVSFFVILAIYQVKRNKKCFH